MIYTQLPTTKISLSLSDLKLPCARSGHCAVADDHNLYVFGGYNPDIPELKDYYGNVEELMPLFRELWKYNFATNTWTLEVEEKTPGQLASMSMVRCGRFIIMYGGTGFPFGYTSTNRVRVFDTQTSHWRFYHQPKKKAPIRSYGQTVAVIKNHLYVFGGTTGWQYTSDVHRVDLHTGEWEKLFNHAEHEAQVNMYTGRPRGSQSEFPAPRYRHEMLCDGDKLYVLGGGNSETTFALEKISAFNLSTSKWEVVISKADPQHGYPGKRRCHGCVQLGNDGFISGGFDGSTKIYDDIWILSLPSLQWQKLTAKLPEPVYFHASAITPSGCLYYHGGVTSPPGDKRTDKLNCVRVKPGTLLQLSWQSVCACIQSIETIPQEKLLELGVPRTLLDGLLPRT
ncbi:kelch domain-containing protein 10-like isoform X2 [Amphiura filiformis]|uniref:kelch domain-containing protein 10-like isoform X2 n=1 Tax=Amphiura filiformis TaxID=82378 RepID=UPI003B2242BE